MTEPSTVKPPEPSLPRRSQAWGVGILVLIFRSLLLGVGGLMAGLIGVAIALTVPGEIQAPPLLERGLRLTNGLREGVQHPSEVFNLDRSPGETQDESRSDAPSDPAAPASGFDPPIDSTVASQGRILITIPLDVLFARDRTALDTDSQAILSTIAAEIQQYPGAVIQVASFTGNQAGSEGDRVLAFEQAKAVESHLAKTLDRQQYHWVVVGYGQSRPRVESPSGSDAPSSRRIEISILPE